MRAINGVIWSAIERVSVQGVQFIVSILLARLLTPSDFGLVAIVLVFSNIFQTINEAGFNTAVVHKQNRDDLDFSTALVTNIFVGFVSYIILFILSPIIAKFYDNDSLLIVMRILPLTLIINGIGLVPVAIYTISVDFKSQARATFSASIISGILGLLCAYFLRNVYAIVVQQIAYSLINVILMWAYTSHKIAFDFSYDRFKSLFSYAINLIGARLISVIFDDIYSLTIGKIYSPATLGYYNRAMSFRQMLSRNFINIVQRVSIPLLCENQNNNAAIRIVLKKFMNMTALIVYPILAGLMVLAQPLVTVLLGDNWLQSSYYLQYICPCGFFYLVSTFNRNVYNAIGRTDLAFKTEIAKKILFLIIFLITIRYKIEVLLGGLILISILEMLIDINIVKKLIKITYYEEFGGLISIFLSTVVMGVVVHFSISYISNDLLKLFVGIPIGIIIYGIICYFFNVAGIRIEIKKYAKI